MAFFCATVRGDSISPLWGFAFVAMTRSSSRVRFRQFFAENILFTPLEFFTSALADRLSLEFE